MGTPITYVWVEARFRYADDEERKKRVDLFYKSLRAHYGTIVVRGERENTFCTGRGGGQIDLDVVKEIAQQAGVYVVNFKPG
jgi:hypothetical protein